MYEQEKEAARVDFTRRFVWNNADVVVLRLPTTECGLCGNVAVYRCHDYEDDVSGGVPICEACFGRIKADEGLSPEWVTQDPEGAWHGVGAAFDHGWKGLWFLFAPSGRYAGPQSKTPGEWPTEGGK